MGMINEEALIFLAEDDEDDQLIFIEALIELNKNIEVKVFESGISLIENLSVEKLPSLIILDLNMPLLNGIEVLAELKKKDEFEKIPKVVWSTSNNSAAKYECLQQGATEFFEKPNTFTNVVHVVERMIKWIK